MQLSDISTGTDLSSISAARYQQVNNQVAFSQVASTSEKPAPVAAKSNYSADTRASVPQTSNAPQTTARSTNTSNGVQLGQYVDLFA